MKAQQAPGRKQAARGSARYVRSLASQRKARSPGMKQYSPPRVMTNCGRPRRSLGIGRCGIENDYVSA